MENLNRNYCRISFDFCGLDYDYTICKWDDVTSQIQIAEMSITECSKTEIEDYAMPQISIQPEFITDEEFKQWQIDNELK